MLVGVFGLILCFTIGILVYSLRADAEDKGEAKVTAKVLKSTLNEVKNAKLARDNLNSNPALRNKLRNRHNNDK